MAQVVVLLTEAEKAFDLASRVRRSFTHNHSIPLITHASSRSDLRASGVLAFAGFEFFVFVRLFVWFVGCVRGVASSGGATPPPSLPPSKGRRDANRA